MSEPVVNEREKRHAQQLQRLHVPLTEGWFDENLFISFLFNAASITIPELERFVIRSVELVQPRLADPTLQEKAREIIHEERAHARVHDAYNAYLQRQGFPVEKYARKTKNAMAFLGRFSPLTRLAFCAMNEHFTACGARQVLDVGFFEGRGVDERMDRVWTWHALEELDHRATAFDIYRACGGGYVRRVAAGLLTSCIVLYLHHACFFTLLRQHKLFFSARAWRVGLPLVLGRRGVSYNFFSDWFAFFKPRFHPNNFHLRNSLQKQLHHYHIESELVAYFSQ